MNSDHAASSPRDRRLQLSGIDAPCITVYVHENRFGANVADRVGGRHVSQRRDENFVARTDVQSEKRQMQRDRAVADGDRRRSPADGGVFPLEAVEVGAGGGNPGAADGVHHVAFLVAAEIGRGDGNFH